MSERDQEWAAEIGEQEDEVVRLREVLRDLYDGTEGCWAGITEDEDIVLEANTRIHAALAAGSAEPRGECRGPVGTGERAAAGSAEPAYTPPPIQHPLGAKIVVPAGSAEPAPEYDADKEEAWRRVREWIDSVPEPAPKTCSTCGSTDPADRLHDVWVKGVGWVKVCPDAFHAGGSGTAGAAGATDG